MGQGISSVLAVIPARWGSTRLPGKALAAIAGQPMIAHVVRRALTARTVDAVVVATDDERIARAATEAGAQAVITGPQPSGTDRVAAAILDRRDWEIVVNVQGDEPMLPGENIDTLVDGMRRDPAVPIATLCRPLPAAQVDDPNVVKVIRDVRGRALYFSRAVIPYPRSRETAERLWRLHLGIYGYRRGGLERFVSLGPSPLEVAEALEQLRALENGMPILVLDAPRESWGVDTPEDLERVRTLLEKQESTLKGNVGT
ncbi:MAG: 3-deoxy-manno-octulosonate cytidylyltransferase [Acidobacteria bacterium]|nr:3-deoxy-manno-octulosonate cytidylyltransferase [Acidobacteriota bacterium]